MAITWLTTFSTTPSGQSGNRRNLECPFFESMPTKDVARNRLRNFLTQSTGPSFRPLEYLCVTATKSIKSTPNRALLFRTPARYRSHQERCLHRDHKQTTNRGAEDKPLYEAH